MNVAKIYYKPIGSEQTLAAHKKNGMFFLEATENNLRGVGAEAHGR